MAQFDDIIEEPNILAKTLFILGGLLSGLAILFYVFRTDRIDLIYEIQMPFGLLFVILISLIFMVLVFILINLYNLLKSQERVGYFTPVTRALVILMLLTLIVSVEIIGEIVYLIVRVIP